MIVKLVMIQRQPTLLRTTAADRINIQQLSRLVGKPTMWFPNRSDTNRPVQSQKRARSLKFWS